MRFYISADIEGASGVVSRDTSAPGEFDYENGRNWMTGDVIAACEAAFECGATEIIVSDSHGNGQNIRIDDLPENVRIVRSWPRPLDMMQGIEEGPYDGALLIGYHAGASALGGVLSHSLHGRVIQEIRLNGRVMPELGLAAANAGHFGVPVIMASGDDAFAQEAIDILGDVEIAKVKKAYSTLSALTLTPKDGQALIKTRVKAAIARIGDFKPFCLAGPVTLDIRFKHRRPAELLSMLSIVERTSAYEIRFVADAMPEISAFLTFVLFYQPEAY